MRRSPVLTGAMVITFALGIGLNTAVFSAVSGMVFRARVENDPSSFAQIVARTPNPGGEKWGVSLADFEAYRRRARSMDDWAAWDTAQARVGSNRDSELILLVSCNFFPLYGLERPRLGRLFLPDECAVPGAVPVAVLSEEIWRSRYHAAPGIIGSSILLNRHPFTVIGIAPARFAGRLRGLGIWIPYTMDASIFGRELFNEPQTPWLIIEGRLRPGYSRGKAQAELSALTPARKVAVTNGSAFEHPGARAMAGSASLLIMSALTLVLLLACTNVTVLLLSRAAARRYEMAVRLSLGASRGQVLQMLLTESMILAGIAGAASASLAFGVPAAIERILWRAPHYPVQPDWVVFAYSAAITLLAGAIAGLAPAAESFRVNLISALKGQPDFTGGRLKWRIRDLLIGAQVAASLFLVTGAGLFARTEWALSNSGLTEAASRFQPLTVMVGVLGAVALVMAVVGIYGVATFAVVRRTKELGIRIALGATRRDIVACVLASGAKPVLWGLAAGTVLALTGSIVLALALATSPAHLNSRDPLVYGSVALAMTAAAFTAMFRPAWRAAKADPAQALRADS